jgi:hypothetical protein
LVKAPGSSHPPVNSACPAAQGYELSLPCMAARPPTQAGGGGRAVLSSLCLSQAWGFSEKPPGLQERQVCVGFLAQSPIAPLLPKGKRGEWCPQPWHWERPELCVPRRNFQGSRFGLRPKFQRHWPCLLTRRLSSGLAALPVPTPVREWCQQARRASCWVLKHLVYSALGEQGAGPGSRTGFWRLQASLLTETPVWP